MNLKKIDTPLFLTDSSVLKAQYKLIKNNLNKYWGINNIVAYPFKTNYEIATFFKKENEIYAEVASKMEYEKAKNLEYSDSQIIYNGPFKENLSEVLKTKIIINLDNFGEIKKILETKNIKANIGLRLNSNLKKSRFGFNIENNEAQIALKKLDNIKINSLHVHLGFFTKPKVYKKLAKRIIDFISNNNLDIKYIDFGGGFPSQNNKPYNFRGNSYFPIEEYIKNICEPLNKFYFKKNKPSLILEPGRFLVDESTILISKIIDFKYTKNNQYIIVDATNNMLSSSWYRPLIIETLKNKSTRSIKTTIYGASCQEDDILFQGQLPLMKIDDFLIFKCVGAYNQNMNSNFIFSKAKHFFKKL